MAVTTWTAGQVLAAQDLNDTFASKLPYSYGTATPSTSVDGFLWYDENDTPPTPKFWDGAAFQALTSGKILQIVRATDSTQRTTTSSSYVDANISVTITPQKSTSAILLLWSFLGVNASSGTYARANFQITDASNNAISGSELARIGNTDGTETNYNITVVMAYDTPATTSAVTYKGRFAQDTSYQISIWNHQNTGQLYAIEVSA